MNTVLLIGAGASRGYAESLTGVHPPLATNFFSTFSKLMISGDFEVKIGDIVNYIRDTRGIPPERQPIDFDENVEAVFAELDAALRKAWSGSKKRVSAKRFALRAHLSKTYDQFIFWFAHVLNEVQNGRICQIYSKLLSVVPVGTPIISFNWDTIIDRVLYERWDWFPDDGYFLQFDGVLHNTWRKPRDTSSSQLLLKVHGSTNWFGPYVTRNLQTGERQWLADGDTVNRHWCLLDGSARFETYKDRWRPGYAPFSYFFPPNDPIHGAPLMPILIPPTNVKLFHEYASIFNPVWSESRKRLAQAERLLVIGYSFPTTDKHAYDLIETFADGEGNKIIEVVDPYGGNVAARLRERISNDIEVILHETTLAQYLGLPNITLSDKNTERALALRATKEFHLPGAKTTDEKARQTYLVNVLSYLSTWDHPFDMTTYDGQRHLNCRLVGEFATHMYGAYRHETYEYRLSNIRFKPADGAQQSIELQRIWIINPLPPEGLTEEDITNADITNVSAGLRDMIRKSFHCKSQAEEDYFVRRFAAS